MKEIVGEIREVLSSLVTAFTCLFIFTVTTCGMFFSTCGTLMLFAGVLSRWVWVPELVMACLFGMVIAERYTMKVRFLLVTNVRKAFLS